MSQARFNTCVSDVMVKVAPAAYFGSYLPDVRPWNKCDGKRIVSSRCLLCDTLDTPVGSVSLPRKEESKQLYTPSSHALLQLAHGPYTRSLPSHARFFQ
jgi:hypothetical protein